MEENTHHSYFNELSCVSAASVICVSFWQLSWCDISSAGVRADRNGCWHAAECSHTSWYFEHTLFDILREAKLMEICILQFSISLFPGWPFLPPSGPQETQQPLNSVWSVMFCQHLGWWAIDALFFFFSSSFSHFEQWLHSWSLCPYVSCIIFYQLIIYSHDGCGCYIWLHFITSVPVSMRHIIITYSSFCVWQSMQQNKGKWRFKQWGWASQATDHIPRSSEGRICCVHLAVGVFISRISLMISSLQPNNMLLESLNPLPNQL